MRLTQSIGYSGAGTVEYLYHAARKSITRHRRGGVFRAIEATHAHLTQSVGGFLFDFGARARVERHLYRDCLYQRRYYFLELEPSLTSRAPLHGGHHGHQICPRRSCRWPWASRCTAFTASDGFMG